MKIKTMDKIKLYNADCLDILPQLEENSVDLILCDLPYGTTCLKWDKIIDFDQLWTEYQRIIKPDGIIALFSIQPFTTMLISSQLSMYRYSWIWLKDSPTGFLNANYAPLKQTEDINIFSFGKVGSLSKNPIRYYPQGLTEVNKTKQNNPNSTWRKNKGYNGNNILNSDKEYTQKYTGYPNNILYFPRDKNAIHPTQKPVDLLIRLIETYTQKGETVLDNCMGSGSTGVACIKTDRVFIGIEKDASIYDTACKRINLTLDKN